MIAKDMREGDRKLSGVSYEFQRKLMMPDEIRPTLVHSNQIQEETEKFDLIKKLESDKAELEAQLESDKLLRNKFS